MRANLQSDVYRHKKSSCNAFMQYLLETFNDMDIPKESLIKALGIIWSNENE